MKMKLTLTNCARAATVAAGVFLGVACADRRGASPTEPLPLLPAINAEPTASASRAGVPKPFRLVLLRPVMTHDSNGDPQLAYATKAVYLRPVMKGEVLPNP
jgi:hypothetical protein